MYGYKLSAVADTALAPDVRVGADGLLAPVSHGADSRFARARETLADDSGQATTEYAMVLVVVAVVAVALFAVGPTALRKVFSSVIDFVVSTIPGG